MKICTDCDRSFDDAQGFCQFDGAVLVDETELLRAALPEAFDRNAGEDPDEDIEWIPVSKPTPAWLILPLGVLIGVVLAAAVYVLWLSPALTAENRTQEQPAAVKRQPDNNRVSQVASFNAPPTASPVEQPSNEAEPERGPVPKPPETAPPRLNEGPISTGSQVRGQDSRVLIKIRGAGSLEADAAWEDGQNLWYRRGSLVSSVRRDRVEAITEIAEPKPAPSEGTKP